MWKVLEGLGLRTVVMEIQALPLLHWQKVPEGSWCPVAVSHIQGVYELVLLFLSPYLRPCNFAFRAFLVSSLHSLFLCVGGGMPRGLQILIPCVTRDLIWAMGVKVQRPL